MEGDRVERRERKCSCSCCDFLWLVTTMEGWFKLIEWVFTLLTFVILTTFPNSSKPKYEFLVFVSTAAWIFVFLYIGLRMLHLYEKLPLVLIQPLISFILCTLAWIGFLISSSLVYADGIKYDNTRPLEISGICGYICTCLFCVESVYYFIRYRRSLRRDRPQADEANDFVEPSQATPV